MSQFLYKLKLDGIPACLVLSLAVSVNIFHQDARAQVVNLGDAQDFAVLAGSGITLDGAIITGNIGSYATPTITGTAFQYGLNHAGNATTQLGKAALATAFADAAGRAPTTTYGAIYDLGGSTLTAGVYNNPSSFGVTGTLTLDAGGNPDAVWIFQAGSTLITEVNSNILLMGGAKSSNVFWQVGSSATLGAGSHFEGSILASASITINSGATLTGRALAQNGAVTMNLTSVTTTGVTIVSSGTTLDLSGTAGVLTGVSITGGTLLLSGSEAVNRIGDTAPISLGAAGSTLQLSGAVTETLGALTLAGGAGARVIDFGATSGVLTFASLTADSSLPLHIWNWSGTIGTGGGTDRLFITNGFAPSNISFFSDGGTTLYSQATGFTSGGELVPGGLVPVPEASTLLGVLGLMAPLAWRERRHWMRCREARG